jgi:hypothetical protein
VAAILVGAVVNFWRSQWTLGRTPLDVDEQRLVDALARLVDAAAKLK